MYNYKIETGFNLKIVLYLACLISFLINAKCYQCTYKPLSADIKIKNIRFKSVLLDPRCLRPILTKLVSIFLF